MSANWEMELLQCLSLSSREDCSASEREQASLPSDAALKRSIISAWLKELREEYGEQCGLIYLATCHRIEFYFYGFPGSELKNLWAELCGQKVLNAKHLESVDAFQHLVEVSSSLASEVLGETQITGQVKQAFENSKEAKWISSPLLRVFEEVLRVTKRIRHESKIGTGTISVAHVAVDGLNDVFADLGNKRALVVGAGSMAQQALERLMKLEVASITWVNRSKEKIQKHPLSGYCEIRDFEELEALLWEHPISVLATSSESTLVIKDRVIQQKIKADKIIAGPKVLLDLGLPRNIDERIHGIHNFLVRNVDEFRDRAENVSSQRATGLPIAQKIVEEELLTFVSNWNHWSQGALVAELFKSSQRHLDRELNNLQSNLRVDEKPKIEYVVRNVYAKMMHQLLESVRSLEESEARRALEALNLAWRQTDISWQKHQTSPQEPKNPLKNPRQKIL
ncbi:glutamyl-tRNA reductase [bacterium]|nr:glutamyl-tRNA reductase [bacterium]